MIVESFRDSRKSDAKVKLAIVHVSPYPAKLPLFNIVCTEMDGIVLFSCKDCADHPYWDIEKILESCHFKYRFLPGVQIGKVQFRPSILWYLWRVKPDVIVAGDFYLQTLFSIVYARLFGGKVLIHSNATRLTGAMYAKRRRFRQWLVRCCDGFIAASSETRKYLYELGAQLDKTFTSIQTIDACRWKCLVEKEKKSKDNLKSELGLNSQVILYVGRLEPLKGVKLLFEAFHRVAERIQNVSLLLVGSGSIEAELKEFCQQESLSDRVVFVGNKQPDELTKYYAAADLFVFPTLGDTFGLVVNEALASGLPVICSPFAGVADLIQEGRNGYILDPRDIDKMVSLLSKILTNEALLQSLKCGALASIDSFTIETSALQFLSAIKSVMKRKKE